MSRPRRRRVGFLVGGVASLAAAVAAAVFGVQYECSEASCGGILPPGAVLAALVLAAFGIGLLVASRRDPS